MLIEASAGAGQPPSAQVEPIPHPRSPLDEAPTAAAGTDWAVFSGAGLSAPLLPTGFRVRNDLLTLLHEAAMVVAPRAVDGHLKAMVDSNYKFEVVLGRLWGTVGDSALNCLYALRLAAPALSHVLAAIHLARGGVHVTVNLDVGIELAYQALATHPHLRELCPSPIPPLRVVASHREFDEWLAAGRPPALLKIHGSLSLSQDELIDPVTVDVVELGQLTPARAAAVEHLATAQRLLVTGYAGEDIDVYRSLLSVIARTPTCWRQLEVRRGSLVPDEASRHSAAFYAGGPGGLAVTGLCEVLGLSSPPAWTEDPAASDYVVRFRRWADQLRASHPPEQFAAAYAWLLADVGDYDRAEAILSEVVRRRPSPAERFRLADVVYHRFRPGDRHRAVRMFTRIAVDHKTDLHTRLRALLRLGDCGRTFMRTRPLYLPLYLPLAVVPGLLVAVLTRNGRIHSELAADAYRALQQLSLRLFERVAPRLPAPLRPLLSIACRMSARLGLASLRLSTNGNRRALVTQHRLALLILADLLRRRPAPVAVETQLRALRDSYRYGDDLSGAGNCSVSLAMLAASRGDLATARAELDAARDLYTKSRSDGIPTPTGTAFVTAAERVIAALARTSTKQK